MPRSPGQEGPLRHAPVAITPPSLHRRSCGVSGRDWVTMVAMASLVGATIIAEVANLRSRLFKIAHGFCHFRNGATARLSRLTNVQTSNKGNGSGSVCECGAWSRFGWAYGPRSSRLAELLECVCTQSKQLRLMHCVSRIRWMISGICRIDIKTS